jgi:hypothetical protein
MAELTSAEVSPSDSAAGRSVFRAMIIEQSRAFNQHQRRGTRRPTRTKPAKYPGYQSTLDLDSGLEPLLPWAESKSSSPSMTLSTADSNSCENDWDNLTCGSFAVDGEPLMVDPMMREIEGIIHNNVRRGDMLTEWIKKS